MEEMTVGKQFLQIVISRKTPNGEKLSCYSYDLYNLTTCVYCLVCLFDFHKNLVRSYWQAGSAAQDRQLHSLILDNYPTLVFNELFDQVSVIWRTTWIG